MDTGLLIARLVFGLLMVSTVVRSSLAGSEARA